MIGNGPLDPVFTKGIFGAIDLDFEDPMVARENHRIGQHDETARRTVASFGGRVVETTGDGVLATFDGPGRAVPAALALRDALRRLGLENRAGVHTGEVEVRGRAIGGLAVHIGARVMQQAGAGEVLVSRTVRDILIGSHVRLRDRGAHALKGVPGDWELFAVVP